MDTMAKRKKILTKEAKPTKSRTDYVLHPPPKLRQRVFSSITFFRPEPIKASCYTAVSGIAHKYPVVKLSPDYLGFNQ